MEHEKSQETAPLVRRKLPATRSGKTHKFIIRAKDRTIKGYIIANAHADGRLGEVFLKIAKAGEETSGMARCWGISISTCLQCRVDLKTLCKQYQYSRFEPAGFTDNPDIPNAHSIPDYVFKWLEMEFPETAIL